MLIWNVYLEILWANSVKDILIICGYFNEQGQNNENSTRIQERQSDVYTKTTLNQH